MAMLAVERLVSDGEGVLSVPAVRWHLAGRKIRRRIQDAKRAVSEVDPLLDVAARLNRVSRKALPLVASLLGHIERAETAEAARARVQPKSPTSPKSPLSAAGSPRSGAKGKFDTDDTDALLPGEIDLRSRKLLADWAGQEIFADLSATTLPTHDLESALTSIVTSVAQVQGEATAVNGVKRVLHSSISKATLRKCFGDGFISDTKTEAPAAGIYSDGLDKPHVVHHSQYRPEDELIYPPSYTLPEGEEVAATIMGMARWHDPRGQRVWDGSGDGGHDPIADLLSNGLLLASKMHDTSKEVALPVHAYTHEVLERSLYAVWLDGAWVRIPSAEGLKDAHHRRRDGEGMFNLTEQAAKELSDILHPGDRTAFLEMMWGGWWGFGDLPLFGKSPHGIWLYRKTLPVALPSGLDTLIAIRYENVYADNTRWQRDGFGDTKAPFADSVAWLPPAEELLKAGPFSLWNFPPPSIIEYVYARSFQEGVEYSEWSATPVQQLPELVAACAGHTNAQEYDAELHTKVRDTIKSLQCKHVLHDIHWVPTDPPPERKWFSTTVWWNVTEEQAQGLVEIYIKSETQFMSWKPNDDAAQNDDGSYPLGTLGTCCLGGLFAAVKATKCVGARVYVYGSVLPIRWTSKFKKMPAPPAPSLPQRAQHAKRCLSDLTKYKGMQFVGNEATFIDLSETLVIEPADESIDECLVLDGTRLTAKGTDPNFLDNIISEKLGGDSRPNPCQLASALQIQYLVWGEKVFLGAFSGERPMLIDLDTQQVIELTRLAAQYPVQPYLLINDTIRHVQGGKGFSLVTLLQREDSICRSAAGLVFRSQHVDDVDGGGNGASGPDETLDPTPTTHVNFNKTATCTWCPRTALWKVATCTGLEKRFAEHEVRYLINGWMGRQLWPFVYRLTKAIEKLPSQARCGYRGYPLRLPSELYTPSSMVFFGAPTLATTDPNLALQTVGGGNGAVGSNACLFSLKGNTCCRIDALSRFSRRGDILFPVNSTFHVIESTSFLPKWDRSDSGGGGGASRGSTGGGEAVFTQNINPTGLVSSLNPGSFLSRRLSQHVEREKTIVRVFELHELDTAAALNVTIRTIMPRLTGPNAQELCRHLFQITQKLEAKKYEDALQIAALPSKGVLLITLPDETSATSTTGTTIAGELLKLLPEKVGVAALNTALFQTARGIPQAVLPLAGLGADPNAVDKQNGNTPLHIAAAAQTEPLAVVQALLAIGADPNEDNHLGDTPIHIAAANTLIPLSEHPRLLDDLCPPSLLNASNARGQTPIHLAAKACNLSTVQALLAKGASPNATFQWKGQGQAEDAMGHSGKKKKNEATFTTPLHEAAAKGSAKICRVLLDAGANPDALNGESQTALHLAVASTQFSQPEELEIIPRLSTKRTVVATDHVFRVSPLHLAASLGELDVVKILLNTPGRDRLELANLVDQNGNTPMRAACILFRIGVVLYLLPLTESGLNPKDFPASKVKNAGPELLQAVLDVECAKVLLLINCGVNTDMTHEGNPLMHMVCHRQGFSSETGLSVVDKLAQLPNAFIQNVDGETPLHICVRLQHKEICKVLLRHTADSNIQDAEGRSPAHIAAKMDLVDMMYVLLYYNRLQRKSAVDVNVVDHDGKTPLHLAAESGAAAVTALLLKEGANASLVDAQGCTPGNLATIHRHEAIVALLPASEKLTLSVEEQKRTLFTAIHAGSAWEVFMLLETFHIDLSLTDNGSGMTPFHTAVGHASFNTADKSQIIEKLVYPGAVRAVIDVAGVGHRMTALHLAAHCSFVHTTEVLLRMGADPNVESAEGLRPLHMAAQNLSIDVLRMLNPVTDVRLAVQDFRPSALHRAAAAGNIEAVKLLCDLTECDEEYICAADSFMGSPSGRPCVLEDPNTHDLFLMGCLPVHYAISRPEFATEDGLKAFERLVTPKSVRAHTHHQRSTPLHCITQGMCHDTYRMAETLLAAGADANAVDADGCTPFALACEAGLVRIAVTLLHPRTRIDGDPPSLPKEFEMWSQCTALVVPTRPKAVHLCREWVRSLGGPGQRPVSAATTATTSTGEEVELDVAPTYQRVVDMVGWAEWKAKFLGMIGSVLTVKDTYLHLEFHVPINDTDYSVETVWFPKSLVTRLTY